MAVSSFAHAGASRPRSARAKPSQRIKKPVAKPVCCNQPAVLVEGNSFPIKARSSDPGIRIRVTKGDSVTITGTARWAPPPKNAVEEFLGRVDSPKSAVLHLEPLQTRFGSADNVRNNARRYVASMSKGTTAEQLAHDLARKVNTSNRSEFEATVTVKNGKSATIRFTKRALPIGAMDPRNIADDASRATYDLARQTRDMTNLWMSWMMGPWARH